jgi:hypothetical protein
MFSAVIRNLNSKQLFWLSVCRSKSMRDLVEGLREAVGFEQFMVRSAEV